MARKLNINIKIHGVDHETFGSNDEVWDGPVPITRNMMLDGINQPQNLLFYSRGWGGECRLEVRGTVVLVDDRGNARVDGEARFFEGASEGTGDLDGTHQFSFSVPKTKIGPPAEHFFRINNTDEGDDFAEVWFSATNELLEVD